MVNNSVDCVTIVSGGMDSITLLYHLIYNEKRTPAVISFQYGQKHAKELTYARTHADRLKCPYQQLDISAFATIFRGSALVDSAVDVPDMGDVVGDAQPVTYVPNRNMIFLALAVAFAESLGVTDIYYGAQQHDMYGYWDTTIEFLNKLNTVYALNRKGAVKIQAPFVNLSKSDILQIGLPLSVDYAQTWSCYRGDTVACGICPTCAERLAAFEAIGMSDPIPYRQDGEPNN